MSKSCRDKFKGKSFIFETCYVHEKKSPYRSIPIHPSPRPERTRIDLSESCFNHNKYDGRLLFTRT